MISHRENKPLWLFALLFFVIAMSLCVVYFVTWNSQDCISSPRLLYLRGDIAITTLTTVTEHSRGLSGHAPLLPNEGMLFQFDTPAKRGFWMKDMLFPIDIIWLDRNLEVLSFFEHLTPDSYPTSYESPDTMLYALEVESGFVARRGIAAGDQALRYDCKKDN